MSGDRHQLTPLLIIALLSALITISASAVTSNPRVRIEPAHSAVNPGETFAIEVMIEGARDLGAFQFKLAYDPSIVGVEKTALGDFLGSTGRSVVPLGPQVDKEAGTVVFGAISFGTGPGPDGRGTLAVVTLMARGEGGTVLDLRDVQVLDIGGSPQPVTVEGARLTVRGGAAPAQTPAFTLVLTGVATPTYTLTPTSVPPLPPTLGVTAVPTETPTEAPIPLPTPTAVIAPTETRPPEAVAPSPIATPMVTKAPATEVTAPTPTPMPSPSPSMPPTPTPSPTIAVPARAAKGPPLGGGVLVGLLAALFGTLLIILTFRRKVA